MNEGVTEYRRLGGTGRGLLWSSSRLYLGTDHLLYVMNERFAETYKRFYLKDIQAFVVRETPARSNTNGILAGFWVLMMLLVVLVGTVEGQEIALWICGIVSAPILLAMVVNTAKGRTCHCYLKTAVNQQEIRSLNRLRTARKVMTELEAVITQTQGSLSPEQIQFSASMAEKMRSAHVRRDAPKASPKQCQEDGRFYLALFGVLLLDGGVTVIDFFFNHMAITIIEIVLTMLLILAVVALLVRQRNSDVSGGLRRVVWGVLAYLGVGMTLGYVLFMIELVKDPQLYNNQAEWLRFISYTSPIESPMLLVLHLYAIFSSFGLGIAGLFLLMQQRRTPRNESIPPVPVVS